MALSSLPSTVVFGGDVHDVSTVEEARATSRYTANVVHLSHDETARKIGESLSNREEVNALLDAHEELVSAANAVHEIFAARVEAEKWESTLALFRS